VSLLSDLPWWVISMWFTEGCEMRGVTKDRGHRVLRVSNIGMVRSGSLHAIDSRGEI